MKTLNSLLGSRAPSGAYLIAFVLVIATGASWYSILKPELKIKKEENEGLRRRIEAAIQPGHAYIGSPQLVRTANLRYVLTIQENRAVADSYKAELTDYLKEVASKESKAQLDVVFAQSAALQLKSAVAGLARSSSAPFVVGILFLALIRLLVAPVSAAVASVPAAVARSKAKRESDAAFNRDLALLQAEADKAFAAQAAQVREEANSAAMADIFSRLPKSGARAQASATTPIILKGEVERLTSEINMAKLSWVETPDDSAKDNSSGTQPDR